VAADDAFLNALAEYQGRSNALPIEQGRHPHGPQMARFSLVRAVAWLSSLYGPPGRRADGHRGGDDFARQAAIAACSEASTSTLQRGEYYPHPDADVKRRLAGGCEIFQCSVRVGRSNWPGRVFPRHTSLRPSLWNYSFTDVGRSERPERPLVLDGRRGRPVDVVARGQAGPTGDLLTSA
jgi:hypothetical protein